METTTEFISALAITDLHGIPATTISALLRRKRTTNHIPRNSKIFGEWAKNGGVLGEEIFCPRADFFVSFLPRPALRGGAIRQFRFRFLDLWIKFGRIRVKVCKRFNSAAT